MNNVYDTLINLGYAPKRSGAYFVTKALFRNGDNPNALSIHQETGRFRDFVTGERGDWQKFLFLALDGNKELIKKYSDGEYQIRESPKVNNLNLMQIKKYDKSLLNKLIPYYDFYTEKGISKETLQRFQVGLATASKMCNRLVFPIFDLNEDLIGFAGRLIVEHESMPKWLIIGRKTNFTYPLHITRRSILDHREVILVESIGDALALVDAGIDNVACLFGVSIQKELLKQLISLNVRKITIALNNDLNKYKTINGEKVPFNAGKEAAELLTKQLSKFFDNIETIIPPNSKNDWGKCSKDEIQRFFQ